MSNDDELDIFFTQGKSTKQGKKDTSVVQLKPTIPQEKSTKVPLLSMKAFVYNFKKFYKEKTRIRNLLSEPAAKQRTISMKIYLKNYLSTYRDVKNMLVQTRLQETHCMDHFQELAFKDLHNAESTHIYVRDTVVDDLAHACQATLDQIFMAKETAFFEKRALIRFLKPCLEGEEYKPLSFETLRAHFNAIQYVSSSSIQVNNHIEVQTIGRFIQEFIGVAQKLEFNAISFSQNRDNGFKLVDVAHFLFENKYRRADVEIIMKFITKVKQLFNKVHGLERNSPIDGDQPLSMELMTMAFNILSQKDKVSTDLINEVVHNVKCVLNEHIDPKTVDRVRKIMEFNLVGDYLHKFFKDLDHQIGHLLTNIQHVSQLIMTGIETIGLANKQVWYINIKQEQLEVLLAFMHRIQESEIDPHMADILQRHGKTVSNLISYFEGELEEAQIRAHSNLNKKKINEDPDMPQVKRVLYADDEELRSGMMHDTRAVIDPYKLENADNHIRRPKLLDVNLIQIHRNAQVQDYQRRIGEMQQPLELAQSVKLPESKEELIMASLKQDIEPKQMPQQYYNLRVNEVDRDLLYEEEFEKIKKEIGPKSKTDMIGHLQSQIENLRKEVQMQKRISSK